MLPHPRNVTFPNAKRLHSLALRYPLLFSSSFSFSSSNSTSCTPPHSQLDSFDFKLLTASTVQCPWGRDAHRCLQRDCATNIQHERRTCSGRDADEILLLRSFACACFRFSPCKLFPCQATKFMKAPAEGGKEREGDDDAFLGLPACLPPHALRSLPPSLRPPSALAPSPCDRLHH